MKPKYLIFSGVLAALALSSCTPGVKSRRPLNEAQREALSSISITQTDALAGAYETPKNGTKNPKYGEGDGLRAMGVNAGINSGGGALGGVVGALIGEAAGSMKERTAVNDATAYYPLIKQTVPQDIDLTFNEKLRSSLKRNRFFGPRLQENAENQVTSTLVAYRLKYNGPDATGNATFIASVVARIEVKSAVGRTVAGGTYEGESSKPYKLAEYAKKNGPSRQSYSEAASKTISSFVADVTDKTRE